MKMIEYFTVKPGESADLILKRLDSRYGLANLFPYSRPIKLMGNAKVLEIKVVNRDLTLKVDGPGFIADAIYNRIIG